MLDKYSKALDATRSFISRADVVAHQDFHFDVNFDREYLGPRAIDTTGLTVYARVELRSDGSRVRKKQYTWGDVSLRQRDVDKAQPSYLFSNWDGKDLYVHTSIANNPAKLGVAQIGALRKEQQATQFSRQNAESCLLGYHSDERLDKILHRAQRISVLDRTKSVGGSDCYVIKAETGNGTLCVWIDPQHGYNTARAETVFITGDLKRAKTTTTTRLENVRFETIAGLWVPMEADTLKEVSYQAGGKEGFTRERSHCRRTEFILNPDHDALASFDEPFGSDPELLEGTPVHKHGDPTSYVWQDDKIIPNKSRRE